MKTNEFLVISMLSATFICSCSSREEPLEGGSGGTIEVSAGIGESTRAVIDADYADNLDVSFARFDNPGSTGNWTAVKAVRAGGTNNTAITFDARQTYLNTNGQSVLIGYHPQAALTTDSDPATVVYAITGDEDIMATELQTGASDNQFTPFTFRHLLTQLQFLCTGSTEAIAKWTAISSIKIQNVATSLTLSLDKVNGASLITGTANQVLPVVNCPQEVVSPAEVDPAIGYLMVFPVADMGTAASAINLEVIATYNGTEKILAVPIDNINGGVKAGESHLITLNFTVDGEISIEAGIAPWQTGNGGGSEITPL